MKQKRAVILSHGGGELANQLWGYISVFAYARERGYQIENPSFYEYSSFFAMGAKRSMLAGGGATGRKSSLKRRFFRKIYGVYAGIVRATHSGSVVSTLDPKTHIHAVYSLPPSVASTPQLERLEKDAAVDTIYFDGWLFRNHIGIEKYRKEIQAYFAPNPQIAQSIADTLADARKKYAHVIGVHIRQGDYRTWRKGAYFIDEKRAREIVEEYLSFRKLDRAKTLFLIASDEAVDIDAFAAGGVNAIATKKNAVEDLFTLSATDEIIGSDSTFGAFASWYGNIPHIVMKKEAIDWEYYRGRDAFFENKYWSWVNF